jgi:hypothetical protein
MVWRRGPSTVRQSGKLNKTTNRPTSRRTIPENQEMKDYIVTFTRTLIVEYEIAVSASDADSARAMVLIKGFDIDDAEVGETLVDHINPTNAAEY